ncbi:MAG: ribonuclease T [Candidatus Competibacteraceae bacterium]
MRMTTVMISIMVASSYGPPARALEITGEFIAHKACPAVQSIKSGANPGKIKLQIDHHYPATGLNKPNGDYVQLRVSGARPELRWVRLSCGELKTDDNHEDKGRYVLALSWQPAFCETKPDKPECRTEVPGRFDADHFTLHGLWPQPERNVFCKVSEQDRFNAEKRHWDRLPEPSLSPNTLTRLQTAMPGTASHLERYEFIKHGSCFPADAETYFRIALDLQQQVNSSKLQELMAGHIGKAVSADEMKRAFEQTFGTGTGGALGIRCIGDVDSRRTLINEIRIPLKGPLTETTSLQQAMDQSAPEPSDCSQGIVDPVGLN